MECPVCKEKTHWNLIDTRREDNLYECIHCKAVASKRMLRQALITNGAIGSLQRYMSDARVEELSMTGFSLLTWADPTAPNGRRSIQFETLAACALVHVLRCVEITWADVEFVLEAVVKLREPDSTEICTFTSLPYETVSRCITVLIQEGRIRQKEDVCDHCWRYRVS